MEVGVAASTITIVKLTFELVLHVKRLVHNVKERDKNLKELEDEIDCLNAILVQANNLYGSNKSSPCSTSEQGIQQALRKVVLRCKRDLTIFEAKLGELLHHRNWALVAWRHEFAAPVLAGMKRSISDRQRHLSMLVQLLQGVQMHQIIDMLGTLTNRSVQGTTADRMISQVTEALEERQDSEGEEYLHTPGAPEGGTEPIHEECTENGRRLLEAIEEGDPDTYDSLLLDEDTSLQEKDSRDRTPLLLAAHLDKFDLVEKLLAINADVRADNRGHSSMQGNNTSDETTPACRNADGSEGLKSTNHRQIDINATDNLGRTALHYCAEFDVCDTATLLLDRGVDINARDNGDYPPAYFAAKKRNYDATELLLSRGATTQFEWPTPTSLEIVKLLEKYGEPQESASVPRPGSSEHPSASTPPS